MSIANSIPIAPFESVVQAESEILTSSGDLARFDLILGKTLEARQSLLLKQLYQISPISPEL